MHADWTTVCALDALVPDVGARARLGDAQVAVFRLSGCDGVFAIDAFDPFSNAPVLSRGIVGDLRGELVVASPVYKQHFNLRTGKCLEDATVAVRTFATRVLDGQVQVWPSSCEGYPDALPSSCEGIPLALPGPD